MKNFSTYSLLEITNEIENTLKIENSINFNTLNPDSNPSAKGYKIWVNLAELHFCKMLTPKIVDKKHINITFQKLNRDVSFHSAPIKNREEKYGTDSIFFTINKNEEPTFLHAYKKALEAVNITSRKQVLNLGINKGDEFELIEKIISKNDFNAIKFIGIDHSVSALDFARKKFPKENVLFYKQDINKLSELKLCKSDLIISIGTFQSPSINYKPFLMSLVQEHLTKNGAFILGFPNGRWIDNELIYGAKAPNYPYSEMSLLYNDVIFAKKYLQQKKFRVTLTGREYIFLTATRIVN